MTSSTPPNDRDREIDRQFRAFDRRLSRLEDTQITPRELSAGFNRVYEEIDALEDKVDGLRSEMQSELRGLNRKFDELNRKFDIVMQYITGQNNP
jgi:predicted RNase H-like nuclease (RuvC/YqgF family)